MESSDDLKFETAWLPVVKIEPSWSQEPEPAQEENIKVEKEIKGELSDSLLGLEEAKMEENNLEPVKNGLQMNARNPEDTLSRSVYEAMPSTVLSERVNKLKDRMLTIFDSISTDEEVATLEKLLAPIEPALSAMRNNKMTTREARKSKGIYSKWKEEDLQSALAKISEGAGLNESARMFNIPKSTLKRYRKKESEKIVNRPIGHPTDLPEEMECDLVQHVLQLENMLYGLTRKDVMKLAFEIAERNNIKTQFNKETRSAGKEWFTRFLRRHPEICLRPPKSISLAGPSGFKGIVGDKFFDLLETLINEHKITPARIFSIDETSHTVVQHPEKILSQKGKHQVRAIHSCERDQNVTGVYAMNACGVFVPPMLVYARKRMTEFLTFGAPPGTIFRCQDKGWMDSESFCEWMRHFIRSVKPVNEEKVLLILDGHSSHIKNLQALELARKHGVILLSLPSHSTHGMQPLDVSFFKLLNVYMSSAIPTILRENPGGRLNVQHIASLVGMAFPRAATMEIAMNGFRRSGIWPVDRNVLSDTV